MLSFENQEVEFKQEYVADIRKEVIAFANASGGTILIGVRKDGTVIGVRFSYVAGRGFVKRCDCSRYHAICEYKNG